MFPFMPFVIAAAHVLGTDGRQLPAGALCRGCHHLASIPAKTSAYSRGRQNLHCPFAHVRGDDRVHLHFGEPARESAGRVFRRRPVLLRSRAPRRQFAIDEEKFACAAEMRKETPPGEGNRHADHFLRIRALHSCEHMLEILSASTIHPPMPRLPHPRKICHNPRAFHFKPAGIFSKPW